MACTLLAPMTGNAVEVVVDANEDAYVLSSTPTTLYGGATTLLVKHTEPPSETMARAFLQFDLSSIPADASIQVALLYMYDQTAGGGSNLNIYPVDTIWSEATVNWDNQPSYDPVAAGILLGYTYTGWYNADVTGLVNEWRDGLRSNHGLLVKEGGYFCPVTLPACGPRTFRSSEYSGFKPYLMVIYDSPTVDLPADMDAHVRESSDTTNYGLSETLNIGDKGCRSYLGFNTAGIPAGATIEYARIRLYHFAYSGGFPGATGFMTSAFRVTESWSEETINWSNKPSHATTPESINVNNIGGIYVGWANFDVTSLVEDWVGGETNHGVVVREAVTSSFASQTGFMRSDEYADPDYKPRIEVFYSFAPQNEFAPDQYLTGVSMGDDCWGDIDGDGDLDLVVCGDDGGGPLTSLFINHLGTLTESYTHPFPDIRGAASTGNLDFGDYDNDGDLDLALAGEGSGGPVTEIYKNNGAGTFTLDTRQSLTPVKYASLDWGDYDNDGDLDLYVQGHNGTVSLSSVYENDGTGLLSGTAAALTPLCAGSADWVDFDGDTDLDLAVTGSDLVARHTIFYENDNSALTPLGNKGLPDVAYSDMAWGDFDSDGDLDLAFMGQVMAPGGEYTRVYQNDGGGGLSLAWDVDNLRLGECAWGDFSNDGKLDVIFCGDHAILGPLTEIFYNDGTNNFSGLATPLVTGVQRASASWADVDSDGDLDLFMTGEDITTAKYAVLYENTGGPANTQPEPPTEFETSRLPGFSPLLPDTLIMRWDGANDEETAERGFYYCVRVGHGWKGDDIYSGTYGSPLMGNVQGANELRVAIPPVEPDDHFYWSVKTIDAGLMASEWSTQQCSWKPDSLWWNIDTCNDDAYVDNGLPNNTYGVTEAINLIVGDQGYSSRIARSYLQFNKPTSLDPGAEIAKVELYVHCRSIISPPYYVEARRENDDTWDENTITWNNAPTAFHPYADDAVRVTPGWCVWDVTSSVNATVDGVITFVLRGATPPEGTLGVQAEFDSKETANAPYLKTHYMTVVGIGDDAPEPDRFALSQNVPNPFNPTTRISFTIPNGSGPEHVTLKIYDVSGRLVQTLSDEPRGGGLHTIEWNGKDRQGSPVASGVYFYRLRWNENVESKKMVLLR